MIICNRPDCAGGRIDETGFCETCGLRPLPATRSLPATRPPRTTARDMIICNRPDCAGGRIDETGFCETCGLPPLPAPRPPRTTGLGTAGLAMAPAAAKPTTGRALVTVEEAEEPEPRLLDDARVPEERRHCGNCGDPVGRSGRDRGKCTHCRTVFDFQPRLHPQDSVDKRYLVQGVLSHGGFGWAYLAEDTQLDRRRVVLKGVISDHVAATVEEERKRLVELENPYIVRIWGYVTEGRYLVLDYAGGSTVAPIAATEPLEPMLAIGLQILEALDYLHGKGFLHCDVKPANIVRGRDRVRLIDFGAVRRIDDPSPVKMYTTHYCPRPGDRERESPTVRFDLFCAAVTLRELCRAHLEWGQRTPAVEALRRLLDRATHPDRGHRFVSARQFAEQLSGVIRLAVGGQSAPESAPHRSVVFAVPTDALDGGLGAVTPLSAWTDGRVAAPGVVRMAGKPFDCPEAARAAEALPAPLPDPWGVAAEPQDADWQLEWERGKASLEKGDVAAAARAFEAVRAAVPGELVPLLALGLCAELQGKASAAAAYYKIVSDTDKSLIAAHFGLARTLLAAGRRAGAITALRRVPDDSRWEPNARIAEIRSLAMAAVTDGGDQPLEAADMARARAFNDSLREDGRLDDRSHALLTLELDAAAAGRQSRTGRTPRDARRRQEDARRRQENALRMLARFELTEREHTALIDLANSVRPVTVWSW